ncbi:MAG: ECF-type sigma factor [Steroidobacter sp.]
MPCFANSDLRSANPAQRPLDAKALARLAPDIEAKLRRHLFDCAPGTIRRSPLDPTALKSVLAQLLGAECSDEDQRRYLLFVAPIARRVLLAHASSGDAHRAQTLNLPQVERWLARLETFDPLSALMIDLHYFAGLSVKETAAVLGVSLQTVVCDLRFARAWLQAYLGKPALKRR